MNDGTETGDSRYERALDGLLRKGVAGWFEQDEPPPREAERPGDTVGHYRLIEELGRGGQATVFLAEDTRLHRKVALKLLRGGLPREPLARLRLAREAEVASQLDHPNICTVYDTGIAGGTAWIAMQYVEGESLAARLGRARPAAGTSGFSDAAPSELDSGEATAGGGASGPAAVSEITALIEKVARALHVAHEASILHRDVKPANIMVTPAGDPVLMDFGLARQEDSELPTLTRTGDLFGTPAYMSPEQLTRNSLRLDRRTDVWSLGVTLYECLALRRPFEEPTREALYQSILTREPPDVRKLSGAVSRDLRTVIETALAKDRDRRYQTALALAEDLARVREQRPIEARPISPVGRLLRWTRRHPARAMAGVLVLLITGAAGYLAASWPELREMRHLMSAAQTERALEEGYLELSEGSPDRAMEALRHALELDDSSVEAIAGIARVWLRRGDPDEALRELERHEAVVSANPGLARIRAHALRDLGREAEATRLEHSLPEPDSPLDLFFLAGWHLDRGHHRAERRQDASSHYEHAVTILARTVLLSSRALYYFEYAHALGHVEAESPSRDIADALLLRWPDSPAARMWAGFALRNVDPATSTAYLQEALRMKPRPEIHNYLGTGYMGMGDHERALSAFDEAIRLSPGNVKALFNRAFVLEAMGRREEATGAYRDALRCDPDNVGTLLSLAAIIRESKPDESVSLLEHARDLDPRNASVLMELAISHQACENLEDAVDILRSAAECAPDDHRPHYLLGLHLFRMRKAEEAAEAYRESIRRNEKHAESHCNLADCLERLGLLDEALAEYRRGHELGSQNPGWAYDSARWVAGCEKLVDWKNRLPAALDALGEVPDADLRGFLRVSQLRKRHDLACELWAEIIARDPEHAHDPQHGDGFHAALDAAQALRQRRAQDQEVTSDIRALERSALTWLRGDLAAIRESLAGGSLPFDHARSLLNAWKTYPHLEILRHPESLSEPEAWRGLWSEVDAVIESR